jgi:hypothetical protein
MAMQPASRQNLPAYQKLQQHNYSRFAQSPTDRRPKKLHSGEVSQIRFNGTLREHVPVKACGRFAGVELDPRQARCLEGGLDLGVDCGIRCKAATDPAGSTVALSALVGALCQSTAGAGEPDATHRLQTPAGQKLYALRKQIPEPVFGIIKSVMASANSF